MNVSAASLSKHVLQSCEALREEPIPWADRKLSPENLKALLLARLPIEPTGHQVEQLFHQLRLEHPNRHGDRIQATARAARTWWVPTKPYWLISAFVDEEDRVTSFNVQYLSGI